MLYYYKIICLCFNCKTIISRSQKKFEQTDGERKRKGVDCGGVQGGPGERGLRLHQVLRPLSQQEPRVRLTGKPFAL